MQHIIQYVPISKRKANSMKHSMAKTKFHLLVIAILLESHLIAQNYGGVLSYKKYSYQQMMRSFISTGNLWSTCMNGIENGHFVLKITSKFKRSV